MRASIFAWALVASIFLARPALAETFTAGPADDVESIANGLAPGDELVLDDGTYTLDSGRFGLAVSGTEAMPIVIRAADGATPHFNRPAADQNIWDLDVEYVVIRGLEFSGGSAGLRFEGARFVTIEECNIHDTGDVALRMNDGGQVYESVRILRNEIHHTNGTGEGMYLGCNDNGCQLANALIEGNYVHHTDGPTVDQGDGIEIKEGSFGNTVRDNVIHNTNYPCILTYSTVGNGGPNVIERNALWNCGDHAIQSAADATIRNNIILGANADGIAMQPHQAGTPSNLVVVHNTILDNVTLRGTTGSVTIANNAIYPEGGEAVAVIGGDTSGVVVVGNVGTGGISGVSATLGAGDLAADFVMAHHTGAPPIDVFPATGSALIGAGEAAHVTIDDFNGTARMGALDVGAYLYAAGGNPGWVITEGFRGSPPPIPGTDGGVTPGRDGGGVTPGSDGGGVGPGSDGGGGPGGEDGGGCGCLVAGAERDGAGGLAVLLALAVTVRCRWRRARR